MKNLIYFGLGLILTLIYYICIPAFAVGKIILKLFKNKE